MHSNAQTREVKPNSHPVHQKQIASARKQVYIGKRQLANQRRTINGIKKTQEHSYSSETGTRGQNYHLHLAQKQMKIRHPRFDPNQYNASLYPINPSMKT
jgi:hypothetical protein